MVEQSPITETFSSKSEKKSYKKTIIFIISIIVLILAIAWFVYYASNNMAGNSIKMANPQILIQTSEGDITLELYPDKAPVTVANFLSYVNDNTYENTVFHRVISGFMIQGGGFTSDGKQKPVKAPIKLESKNELKNEPGTIAMARTNDPDSATDQFFINTVNNDFLNYAPGNPGYAVFGKVINGMDIVKKIESSKTTTKYKYMEDWPVKDIIIIKISEI